jgi:hypothetical protein
MTVMERDLDMMRVTPLLDDALLRQPCVRSYTETIPRESGAVLQEI